MATPLALLSTFDVPDTTQWSSPELQQLIKTTHSVGNLETVLYWVRQELLHIKQKAVAIAAAAPNCGFRILDIDTRLVQLVVDGHVSEAVSFYVEEYATYRWEDGIAPPEMGMTLEGLATKQMDEKAKREAMLAAFDLSKGKYISLSILQSLTIDSNPAQPREAL